MGYLVVLGLIGLAIGWLVRAQRAGGTHTLRVDREMYEFMNGARTDADYDARYAAMDRDVARRNAASGREIFGRPEWESSRQTTACQDCGIVPLDLKRVFNSSGGIIGVFCTRCAQRYL